MRSIGGAIFLTGGVKTDLDLIGDRDPEERLGLRKGLSVIDERRLRELASGGATNQNEGRSQPVVKSAPVPRGPRRSPEEIRRLMVNAALELLVAQGLGSGTERITLKGVFDYLQESQGIRLHYASVLGRIWVDLSEFQRDVAVAIASIDGSTAESEATVAGFLNILRKSDRTTLDGRWQTINRFCLYLGESNLNELVESPTWPLWVSIWAVSMSHPDATEPDLVRDALTKSYGSLTTNFEFAFEWALSWLGFRVKAPLTTRQLSTAVSALAEGCALRDRLRSADIRDIKLPTGTKGRRESWTLFGIGLEALCRHFLEEIPSWEPGPIDF